MICHDTDDYLHFGIGRLFRRVLYKVSDLAKFKTLSYDTKA